MNFKYIKFITLFFSILLTSVPFTISADESRLSEGAVYQSSNDKRHTVVLGETVYSIAKVYNVTVVDIYDLNPNAVNGIKAGDVLRIPDANQLTIRSKNTNVLTTYTVKPKETLYSISKTYGVSVEDIIDANPDLKSKPLNEGQVLNIPRARSAASNNSSVAVTPSTPQQSQFRTHQVAAKETIYGIARQYGVTAEALIDFNPILRNGLKIGSTIIIPVLENVPSGSPTNQKNLLQDVSGISIGIVLPFVNTSDGQSARFVEYYEGFLLALQEMKAKGFSANVYVFDMGSTTGTDKLKSLLDTYEMKYLDLIIGGVSNEQIATISSFAKREGINYVIPFPTKANEVQNNPRVFQVNAPYSILYANVANTFVNLFPNVNLIYVNEQGLAGDRSEFISELNKQLPRAGMIANTVVANDNLKTLLSSALLSGRKNVILPTSSSEKLLQILMPALNELSQERADLDISLFGHTAWQTYSRYFADYGKYDTYIYSPFYMNENESKTRQFMANYQRWYNNKTMINTHPRYGALGYDTGISFLTALWKEGKDFASKPRSTNVPSLQTPFFFERMGANGGYMNNGFYLIHYKKDGSIIKTEYGR